MKAFARTAVVLGISIWGAAAMADHSIITTPVVETLDLKFESGERRRERASPVSPVGTERAEASDGD